MAVVTAKLAARAGARGVADASLGNGTRLTSGLSAVGGVGGVVSSSPLIISSRENMVEEEPNQSPKKRRRRNQARERWRSATRETPSACSGGSEAFPERELCHLQGRAMWITTRKRRNADRGGVHAEEQHVQGGPRAAQVSPRFHKFGNLPTRGVERRECGQLAMLARRRWGGQGDGGF